jgi:hypothetical protein
MITNNKVKRCIIASMIVSVFFTTLFFPWTVDIYGSYFKYPSTMRTEEVLLYLLIPVIIPVVIPVSILASLSGGYIGSKLINDRNVMNKKISAS